MPRETGDILRPLVALPDFVGGCWLWLGKVNAKTGYGHKQFAGKTVLAHRWMYQLFRGWVPKGAVINHLCSNRRCVNPSHMEVTTTAGNCRHGKGTKLTKDQVTEIKALIRMSRWGQRKVIAKRYGVSEALISDIKYGRAWADVA